VFGDGTRSAQSVGCKWDHVLYKITSISIFRWSLYDLRKEEVQQGKTEFNLLS
jgi:hypothetical protein